MSSRLPASNEPAVGLSRLQLLALLHAMPQAITCYDRELRRIWINHAAAAAADLTPHAALAPACLSPGNATQCGENCPVRAARQTGRRHEREFRFADGRIRRVHAEPLLNSDGSIDGVVEILEDVTAQRRAPVEPTAPQQALRAVLDAISDAVLVVDPISARITDANAAALELFGQTRTDLLRRSLPDLRAEDAPRDDGPLQLWLAASQSSQVLPPFAWRCRAAAGRIFWAEVNLRPAGEGVQPSLVATLRDITARKQSEELLRASEATFRGLLDSVHEAICVLDDSGAILEVNRAFERSFGLARAELVNRTVEAFAAPDRNPPERLRDARRRALEGQPQQLEFWARRPDGFILPVEINLTTGTYFGRRAVIGVLRDLTLRKHAEEERERAAVALRQSEERFRHLLASLPDVAVQGYAPDGTVRYWNEASERLYGYSAAEALGRDIVELIVPEDLREPVRRAIRQTVETGQPMPAGELTLQRRDGTVLLALSSHAIVQTSLWGLELYCFDIDITERRRVETERLEAAEKLRRSDERFRTLLEKVPTVAVQGYAPDGTVRYWNRASEVLYGYTAAEAIGRNLVDLIIPPQMRDEVRLAVRQMTESGQPIPASELQLVRKDGTPVSVFSSHAVVHTTTGGAELYCLDFELTAQKHAEASRLEMQRQLLHAQKLESLGVLAGGIAHDFNNLLTAILGNLDLALGEIPPFGNIRPCIEDAANAARHAAELTRQILAYSGHGRFVLREVDVSVVVAENAAILRAAVSHNVSFQLELSRQPLPTVLADAGQVHQVVINLITNAAEALGESCGTVVLRTGVEHCDALQLLASRLEDRPPPGEFAFVEVTDTGCGMDAVTQQRMFEPFFTTKFAGRGLGMSAVLGILRAHHGAIFVNSTPAHGTVVRVLFPVSHRGEPASLPAAPEYVPPASELLNTTPLQGTLLIIDDEEPVRTIGERMAARLGLDVLSASDGRKGMDLFRWRAGDIVCVIVDLTMPVMNGIDCFQLLHELRPDVPVILASGYPREDLADRFRATGFADFLQKPFTFQQLDRAIRGAIARKK